MSMKTVTTKTKAWITPYSSVGPQDLMAGKRVDELVVSNNDMTGSGWTFVGEAEVTVHIPDAKTMVANKVEALRNEAAKVRAEATATVARIESQIQNLLAIEYQP